MHPSAIPLSLYLHWPWCVRKCPYCDFNSHAKPEAFTQCTERYTQALIRDLHTSSELVGDRVIETIFIGGGTPSLMSPQAVQKILDGVRSHFQLSESAEITMEANPGTVDESRFEGFREAGVNRLSIGVQSFNDTLLKRLGRIHNSEQALSAAQNAVKLFDRVNLDIMFALPGQTLSELQNEINQAVALGVAHLSFYQLTIEPNTVFAKYEPQDLPDEDTCALMQDTVIEQLALHGYQRYEVSGYSQAGKECRHNQNYWQFGDYIAAGAGAHSKVTLSDGRILRQVRYAQPESFMKHALNDQAVSEMRYVESQDLPFEFMLNALRLVKGVPNRYFQERTGLSLDVIRDILDQADREHLLENWPERIQPSQRGMNYLSDLQERFL